MLQESYARWLADRGRLEQAITEYQKLLYTPAVADDIMLSARLQVALRFSGRARMQKMLPRQRRPCTE